MRHSSTLLSFLSFLLPPILLHSDFPLIHSIRFQCPSTFFLLAACALEERVHAMLIDDFPRLLLAPAFLVQPQGSCPGERDSYYLHSAYFNPKDISRIKRNISP